MTSTGRVRVRPDRAAAQRRTVWVLAVSQAFSAVGITIGIATASLLALEISGSEKQAGLAQTFQVLGTAGAAWTLARLMSARGRRVGLAAGHLVGATGAALCVLAGAVDSMPLLLAGAALLGATTASGLAARYAATDLAPPLARARALGVVVWATTVGAVAGPNLTGASAGLADRLGTPVLTGPFALACVSIAVAGVLVLLLLRPDPLLLARELAGPAPAPAGTSWSRMVAVVRERPRVGAAIGGMAAAHAAMIAVMVMTPLHMDHGGAELELIGLVISVHVLGMFAFSPVVGWLADLRARHGVLGVGGGLLLASMLLSGLSPEGASWQIVAGLFLLGLGWSFATVAAAAIVADDVPLSARTDVQGVADLVMSLTAAAAGGVAGLVVGLAGYPMLTVFAAVLAVAVLGAAWAAGKERAGV